MIKKSLFFIALLGVFVSCEKEEQPVSFGLGDEVEFKMGQTVYSENNDLSLEILDINDSRCPSDVVCIWQGEAKVKFAFEHGQQNDFTLSTFDPQSDTIDNYVFTLVDVSPYPISTETIPLEDYKVTLRIEEL